MLLWYQECFQIRRVTKSFQLQSWRGLFWNLFTLICVTSFVYDSTGEISPVCAECWSLHKIIWLDPLAGELGTNMMMHTAVVPSNPVFLKEALVGTLEPDDFHWYWPLECRGNLVFQRFFRLPSPECPLHPTPHRFRHRAWSWCTVHAFVVYFSSLASGKSLHTMLQFFWCYISNLRLQMSNSLSVLLPEDGVGILSTECRLP